MIEAAVYSIGTAHAGLSALVGTRIYPVAEEREHDLPRLVYDKDGSEPVETVWKSSGWARTTFRFRYYAATALAAKQGIEQVRAAYARYHGTVAGHAIDDVRALEPAEDEYDPDLAQHYAEVDLEFFHN